MGAPQRRGRIDKGLRALLAIEPAAAADAGLLAEITGGARLEPEDLRAYLAFQGVARQIGQPDTIEYWKSAPYLLNFMGVFAGRPIE